MRKVMEPAIRSELDHVRKPTMRYEEFPYFICGEGGRSGFPVDRTTSSMAARALKPSFSIPIPGFVSHRRESLYTTQIHILNVICIYGLKEQYNCWLGMSSDSELARSLVRV